jgi:WhiB family redox-sensing transcriptional regulator
MTCPVAEPCLEYALETNQRAGIWGGTTEEERKSLRRKWLAGRRRAS